MRIWEFLPNEIKDNNFLKLKQKDQFQPVGSAISKIYLRNISFPLIYIYIHRVVYIYTYTYTYTYT